MCSICQYDFKVKEKYVILQCLHRFHKECVTCWFERKNTCPVCTRKVTDEAEADAEEEEQKRDFPEGNDNPENTYAIFGEWPVVYNELEWISDHIKQNRLH